MNPAIETMLKKYSCTNRLQFERAMKEIIQEITLVGLWRAKFFEHAAFYGGTALRILYGLDRFSEDLDFTLLEPNSAFTLEKYNEAIAEELTSYGFTVTVDSKTKEWQTEIRSAFIKANTLGEMVKIGMPSNMIKGIHPDMMFKIKVEVDTDPLPAYEVETRFLLQPINVGIRSVILRDIFAGKMHALLFRQWKGRVKGRDWYDWLWFLRQGIPLNLNRFAIQLQQDHEVTIEQFQKMMHGRIDQVDIVSLKADILPYIVDPKPIQEWTKDMLRYFVTQMKYE